MENRQIKFRAWCNTSSKMIGWGEILSMGQYMGNVFVEKFNTNPPKPVCNLMQFTGLFDKNGKEIYEGDIVKFTPKNNRYSDEFIGEIFYRDDEAAFFHTFEEGRPSKRFFNLPREWTLEIIGNIFENPELITSTN